MIPQACNFKVEVHKNTEASAACVITINQENSDFFSASLQFERVKVHKNVGSTRDHMCH